MRSLFFLLSLLFLFTSCDPDRVFDENEKIPDSIWNKDFTPEFTANVEDTSLLYNVYINIRHTSFYQWRNLWILVTTTFPDGQVFDKKVALELANKEGKWYGDCLGDICDLQIPIQEKAYFDQSGEYTFKLQQIMRTDNLPLVMSIGLRIEKAGDRELSNQ